MLDKHLIARTSPNAKKENIIFWKDYRVTVLQDRLFRVEKSPQGQFRDDATQSVWFRDMEKQNFQTEITQDSLIIATERCKLLLKEKREDCRVEIDGKWAKIDNAGNLKGTYRTLDCCDGDVCTASPWGTETLGQIKLENGVCSLNGVAVFDDANSLTLGQDGEVKSVRGEGTDEYIFAYGNDYREAVKALYLITGSTPIVPRFALGNWWSRYYVYTDKEYLRVLNYFENEEVPLTVATIDMDWHWSTEMEKDLHIEELGRNTEFYGGNDGWTGYSWNTRLFPNHKKFLKEIEKKELKITLNLHPADGFRWWEDCYGEMASAMGVDAETGKHIPFDIGNPQFINAYFSVAHKPHEKDGVRFWWIDWQQGAKSQTDGLDPLWALNHYHYLDNGLHYDRALILSRYCGVGSHRYPLGFSGDTHMTWNTLDYLPRFTAAATNVGYTWWSHDIGGHMLGEKSDEMYLRHLQYGVCSPINRLHCSSGEVFTKEPSYYGNGAGEIAKNWLKFRHSLIPYLYTASYKNHAQGEALIEPLYYQWKNPQAYEYANEYRFGSELLVAPVTQKAEKDGFARVKGWIPQGIWTDIFTGDKYEAGKQGKKVTFLREMENIPVLIKAGGILPLSAEKGNSVRNPKAMEIRAYEGNGEYTLYEDGAEEGKTGAVSTAFKMQNCKTQTSAKQILTIRAEGDFSVIPAKRLFKIRFKDLPLTARISVYVNGKRKSFKEVLTACPAVDLWVAGGSEYKIVAEYNPLSQMQRLLLRARNILTRANMENLAKKELYAELCKATNKAEYKKIVQIAPISKGLKLRLKEIL